MLLVLSNVRLVCEKQCVGGRKRSHCENGSSNNEVSTNGTEPWQLVKCGLVDNSCKISSKTKIFDLFLLIEECWENPNILQKDKIC